MGRIPHLLPMLDRSLMSAIFGRLKGKLVVSCQASPGDPLDSPDAICRMALAAIGGGAAGLRINSPEHIAYLRRHTDLPIIGIQKQYGPAGLHITPNFAAASALAAAGASMIALDCTDRIWPDGDPWQALIPRIQRELRLPVMADVATLDEAQAAVAAGADCVGTTLNGYTERTRHEQSFNWTLLAQMAQSLGLPIMAEGHISSPEEARRALSSGAWSVIVGSAITRPGVLTANFVRAIEPEVFTAPAIGVDIGGTSIKAALVLPSGETCFPAQVPTHAAKGRDAILAGLVQVIEQVLSASRENHPELAGLGIATAGAVDHRDGSIFAATDNLPGWAGFPLRAFAEGRFQLPTCVLNDAHAAVLSEQHFGSGRSLSDFVAITIGTGIGGGIVSAGKLLLGQHGFAGSIGHTVVQAGGQPCNCGRAGCLEAYVSTAGLIREYRGLGGLVPEGMTEDAAIALRINQLARQGDVASQKAYAVLSGYLAEAIANLFNLLDPQAVLLSGGLIEDYPQFVTAVELQVRQLLHFGAKRQPQVRAARAGRNAGIQGAAALVFESCC
jgi:N-acetylmannosamine-6-phosphate 2-epimerase / N-acetylmannosamine kinase